MDDSKNDPQDIQDADIVESDQAPVVAGDAEVVINLGELIKNNIDSIENLRVELKKTKEMFEDGFNGDEVYRTHTEEAKKAAQIKAETRSQIMKQPAMAQLAAKTRGLSSDLKEKKMALSEYLLEYQRLTGANEIEGKDGDLREIINEAKVVKRNAPKKK